MIGTVREGTRETKRVDEKAKKSELARERERERARSENTPVKISALHSID